MLLVHSERLSEAARRHSDAASALAAWQQVVEKATWRHLKAVRQTYAHADAVELESGLTVTVFNVRGNNYRLLTAIDYESGIVNVLQMLTHAEYDKEKWKKM